MGHQSYVLKLLFLITQLYFLSKISKIVKSWNNLNSFLLKINKNYAKKNFFGYHDPWKIYRAPKLCILLCTETTVVFPKTSCDVHLFRGPWLSPRHLQHRLVPTWFKNDPTGLKILKAWPPCRLAEEQALM